jgi:hypothetical protein
MQLLEKLKSIKLHIAGFLLAEESLNSIPESEEAAYTNCDIACFGVQ